MIRKNKKLFNLVFLLAFLVVTVFINVCHTDNPLGRDPLCPACHFHSCSIAIAQIAVFELPRFALVEIITDQEAPDYVSLFIVDAPSRSPPRV